MLGKAVVFSLCLALLWVWETVPATAQSLPDPPPRDRQTVGPFPETEWTDEHRALGMADEKTRRVAQSPEASGWTDEERTLHAKNSSTMRSMHAETETLVVSTSRKAACGSS